MDRKIFRSTLLATIVMAVLCAGTVSARRLSQGLAVQTTCRGFCTKKTGCPNILGCACVFNNPGATTGVCNFIAVKPAK